ncbi:hypothetical protein IPZ61_17195 [Streptomyces sioyaensis]|uniref:hypothetical protein n=1 Tax=Streptomyces sioyaensis TaxID=67364 RepID=UPI001F467B22|nr:hypothetical protein [Streptomyces sioyaensis]MCF3175047.1 hypothetical protein [Streptomyces sioyaensis]
MRNEHLAEVPQPQGALMYDQFLIARHERGQRQSRQCRRQPEPMPELQPHHVPP